MNREAFVDHLKAEPNDWDFIVIGGGATGLGAAVEAASRGYRTLLLEQNDFAGATSSRSTKLIHGGLRYLQQGNIRLVRESLLERGRLLQNAPHLVHAIDFALPAHSVWELGWYGSGLKLYDALALGQGIGRSRMLGRDAIQNVLPTVAPEHLRGGVLYHDAQFDDARLAVALAQTLAELGGVPLNYLRADRVLKNQGQIRGVVARDLETGREIECRGRVVINAAGIFSGNVLRMDDAAAPDNLTLSRGTHIVLDRSFFPGTTALIIPKTDDGRVLFAIPWMNRVLVGTTDVSAPETCLEPRPSTAEIEYLLDHIGRYLVRQPGRDDIMSAWAGLRPLANSSRRSTALLPRGHHIDVSPSALVTISGGKWTTYRRMGEDVLDAAEKVGGFDHRPSRTATLKLHKSSSNPAAAEESLHPELNVNASDIRRAVREEMARTLDDVLARRTRALLLDARAAMAMAQPVASIMAKELARGKEWERKQIGAFSNLARRYSCDGTME